MNLTLRRFKKTKSNLNDKKTPGTDNITSEVIKLDYDNTKFSNKLLNDDAIPDQWSEIYMLPLPKNR